MLSLRTKELLAHFGFCATGVISAVIINYTQLHGMKDDFVEIFPSFVGPSFCCVFLFFQSNERRFDWRFWIVLFCDLAGMLFLVASISLAGSALFFITFSWITVMAAMLKKCFLGKDQTRYQWFALLFMTFGLCASAAGAKLDYGIDVFYGILCGFASAIVYSIYYITCDIIGHMEDAPSPESLAAFDGLVGTWILGFIIIVFKGPEWDTIVIEPVQKEHGGYHEIAFGYMGLAVSYLVHQWAFFYIAKYSGCVLAGVNKAIQTVTVFVVSTVFCPVQPSQCFSYSKAAALVLVVIGVLMYSHASSFVEDKAHSMSLREKEIEMQKMPLSGSALENWTAVEVEQWVLSNGDGFQRLAAALKGLDIDGSDLATVDENALKDLGFESHIIRRKFLKLLANLIAENTASTVDPAGGYWVTRINELNYALNSSLTLGDADQAL